MSQISLKPHYDDIGKYDSPCVEIIKIELRETILQMSGLYEEEEEPWYI